MPNPSKETCDQYAVEVVRRFEEFSRWTMENWPYPTRPLVSTDFSECRRELAGILGEKLSSEEDKSPSEGGAQYVDLNPAPWP